MIFFQPFISYYSNLIPQKVGLVFPEGVYAHRIGTIDVDVVYSFPCYIPELSFRKGLWLKAELDLSASISASAHTSIFMLLQLEILFLQMHKLIRTQMWAGLIRALYRVHFVEI